jgi:hypothetical protein
MSQEQTVFSQLMEIVPRQEFHRCVKRYAKDLHPRKFSYRDQFLSMAFAQLTYRESLRDIEVCLSALGPRAYAMGLRSRVVRSTLAHANNTRDWRIWSDFARVLVAKARKLYADDPLGYEFDSAVYALDSTTISLCLSLCPWAKFQKQKGGIKLHTQLELRGNIPSFALISGAKMSNVSFLDDVTLEAGALYVMDRGYFDLKRLFRFSNEGAFFVTRLKRKIYYRRSHIFYRNRYTAVRCDALIVPLSRSAQKNYPQRLRLVEYFDSNSKKLFVFITNNLSLSAQTIADIYRSRWQIELFFKWIKQHLRIKAFFGTSENAVKTQIWIAVSVYLLVAILKKQLRLNQSLHTILQVLSISTAEKSPVFSLLQPQIIDPTTQKLHNQLNLFEFPIGH